MRTLWDFGWGDMTPWIGSGDQLKATYCRKYTNKIIYLYRTRLVLVRPLSNGPGLFGLDSVGVGKEIDRKANAFVFKLMNKLGYETQGVKSLAWGVAKNVLT